MQVIEVINYFLIRLCFRCIVMIGKTMELNEIPFLEVNVLLQIIVKIFSINLDKNAKSDEQNNFFLTN